VTYQAIGAPQLMVTSIADSGTRVVVAQHGAMCDSRNVISGEGALTRSETADANDSSRAVTNDTRASTSSSISNVAPQ